MEHKKYQQRLSERPQNTEKLKSKYREGVQHQFMTNYYLSKYDSFMMKQNQGRNPNNSQNAYQSAIPTKLFQSEQKNHRFNTQISSVEKKEMSNRKNFKMAILQKKYRNSHGKMKNINKKQTNFPKQQNLSQRKSPQRSPSNKKNKSIKNFKEEVQQRNSKKKQSRENYRNFHKLEGSIINELYSPSPSKIQSAKNYSIQIQHKTSYGNAENSSNPFILFPTEEGSQDNIEIHDESSNSRQQDSRGHYYSVHSNSQNDDLSRIEQGIRSSFEKRKNKLSPSPKKSQRTLKDHQSFQESYNKKPHKNERQKYPPRSPNNSNQYRYEAELNAQEEYLLPNDTIRPGFYHMQREKIEDYQIQRSQKSLEEKQERKQIKNYDSKVNGTQSAVVGNQTNYLSRSVRNSRFSKSNQHSNRPLSHDKNSDSFQDSLNNINKNVEYSRDEKTPPQSQFQSHYPYYSPPRTSRSHDKPPTQFREDIHELSMISRFSMTSDEGGYVREHIEQEINENQFGPYQQALSNLKDLIDQFPHVWPIFVVGQRILQDRQQYDMKRQIQDKEARQIQTKIKNKKKQIKQRQQTSNDIDNNSRTILYLIRKLASQVHSQTL